MLSFNVADGHCRNCEEGRTAFCTGVNLGFTGGAYGCVVMGPYQGGQAQYLCPVCGLQCAQATGGERSMRDILRYWRIFSQRVSIGWCRLGSDPGERGSIWSGARWVDGGV